jgi:hypothetical protein
VLDQARAGDEFRVFGKRGDPGFGPARLGQAVIFEKRDDPAGRRLQANPSEPGDARSGFGHDQDLDPAWGLALERFEGQRHGGIGVGRGDDDAQVGRFEVGHWRTGDP